MLKHTCVAAAVALAAGAAHAQSRPKPDDPRSAAPPPARASAFEGYRPYRDEPPGSWREVNDEVGRVGGHSGVVRAEREAASPPPPARPAQPSDAKGRP
jgi:hypothetical protein